MHIDLLERKCINIIDEEVFRETRKGKIVTRIRVAVRLIVVVVPAVTIFGLGLYAAILKHELNEQTVTANNTEQKFFDCKNPQGPPGPFMGPPVDKDGNPCIKKITSTAGDVLIVSTSLAITLIVFTYLVSELILSILIGNYSKAREIKLKNRSITEQLFECIRKRRPYSLYLRNFSFDDYSIPGNLVKYASWAWYQRELPDDAYGVDAEKYTRAVERNIIAKTVGFNAMVFGIENIYSETFRSSINMAVVPGVLWFEVVKVAIDNSKITIMNIHDDVPKTSGIRDEIEYIIAGAEKLNIYLFIRKMVSRDSVITRLLGSPSINKKYIYDIKKRKQSIDVLLDEINYIGSV